MENTKDDKYYMQCALAEAKLAYESDEVPIGAVVVLDGVIIAKAHNLVDRLSDPTAHAEMQAITSAANHIGGKYLTDCTIYVTVEPCPMCAAALSWAQIARVVYGTSEPKRGYTTISPKLLHPKTKVTTGVCGDECSELMTTFFKKLR
ncbi:MAG: nucleoside deaminase [Rikenellaceae bacterium]